jgi:excisionase family DNA binding protein
MEKEFFNINELSEHLGIKKSTLYGMVENGDLPHYRIGRLIRFRCDDVDSWIEAHRRETISAEKKAKEIMRGVKNPKIDIDRIIKKSIEEANEKSYNAGHGKSDRIKGLRKEVEDGTL